jgi:hypothetical protein
MKLEVIEWDDAWVETEEMEVRSLLCAPYKTVTVGWVIKENAQGIIITPERWTEHLDSVNYPTFIPKKMITNRTVIKDDETQETAES